MANIQINFNLNSAVTSKLQVTIIDCQTNVNLISQYITKTTQEFTIVGGKNTINFEVADGEYNLANFKFRLFIEGVYYETECTSKEINCGATCVENYVFTGAFRCVQLNGTNTGNKELQKVDLNAFCTGNSEMWIDGGQDFINCPLATTLTPEWDVATAECINGETKITVKVKNNEGNLVEFLLDDIWYNATIGNNSFSFIKPSNGVCNSISFRLKNTTNVIWGCYQSLTSDVCFIENNLSSGTIQVKVFQECQIKVINNITYSGIFIKLVPFTPSTNLAEFIITWSRDSLRSLTVPITQLSPNEWVFENNTIKEPVGINVTIANQNDSYTLNIWGNTCNHDDFPINCPNNNRDVILNKQFYNVGETISANYTSGFSPCGTEKNIWYNTNLPTGFDTFNYSGVISAFPAVLHPQPLISNICKECHGWTEIHLRGQGNVTGSIPIANVYTNLYQSEQEVYDGVLNKFSGTQNIIKTVYTTDEWNLNSQIYKDSAKTQLYESGYMSFFEGSILKKVKLVNGIVTEVKSNVNNTDTTVVGTKILAPFAHYQNGNYIGNGYVEYDGNQSFLYFASKLQIAADGLTISETALNNYYWKFNKELMIGNLTNFKIPPQYKGTVIELQLVKTDLSNSFFYTILVGQ